MNQRTQPLGMGIWIAIGFVVVLALMVALGATGLRYVAEANQRLKEIAQSNNIKTEFATLMHSALRERALSMHALPILADPFDKDAEIQRFNTQGAIYVGARERLERMSLNHEEKRILAHILELTREAQPEVQAVVEMAVFNDNQQEIFERMRSVAMPRQRAIAEQVGILLELQREQTATAVRNAEASYEHVRNLMLGLGTVALLMGVSIAWIVSKRVTRQAK
ncbi:MAG: MCP four helix bundle domain-containing protein [Thiobacillus sp.]|nr:MCP four helix bundle domain-containing protein [Thiobacillus sp.]